MSDSEAFPSTPGPSTPITASYTYHSALPTASGPYILGVDEAGRGPVLGPLVYGVAYCPASWQDELGELGFNDSKQLSADTRSTLYETLSSHSENLAWAVRVLSPQDISAGMLKGTPINLNQQSKEATILLIREVLDKGINLSEIYVDALGSTKDYGEYLTKLFPGIKITVETKADAKYKIVGAASVAAKKTRDVCIETWCFEEADYTPPAAGLGSGYPSDPNTKDWLQAAVSPVFGFPKLVRFSWQTVKTILEKRAHPVKWIDEDGENIVDMFKTAQGLDKGRCGVAKDLHLASVTSF
ncbi:ribonuclease H-like domain-containing protein [Mucidula mucida]|nr:ribonuclease H-like domain-containing protein [Mucidula mucida]